MDRDCELQLVGRLRAGDQQAFDSVHAEFNVRLFTFLARLSRSRDRAEDLLEETWLRLVRHAPRLEPDTRLGPWLFTVARNLYVSYCRSRALEQSYLDEGNAPWPPLAVESPLDLAAASELHRRLEAALASLPAIYREVLLLVAVDGLDHRDAAAVCGVTASTFRQRLKRARDLLTRRLGETERAAPHAKEQ
jgi:RNA polymerase sigma-70 factor (ECF subfamily)